MLLVEEEQGGKSNEAVWRREISIFVDRSIQSKTTLLL